MRSLPRHLLLALVLAMAGCVGDDAPDDALTTTADGSDDAGAAPTTEATGNATSDGTDDAVLEVVDVHIEDKTALAAVVCPPAVVETHCPNVGGWPGYGWSDDMQGRFDAVDLTLTWEASAPGNEDLLFYVLGCLEDECALVASGEGPSPLVLDTVEAEGPFDRYVVEVSTVNRADGVAAVFVSPEQPFVIDGTITLATDATA